MTRSLYLTVQATPIPKDISALRETLEIAFPLKENIPYLNALCGSSLSRVTAQRLGALSLLPSLLTAVDIPAQDLIFKRNEHGRPHFTTKDGLPVGFDFNLSHTDTHVAAALLIGEGRVGVDIEEPIPPERALPLIHRYCTEGELSRLGRPTDDTLAAEFFTDVWVMREAIAKQDGGGMPLRFDTTSLPNGIVLWCGRLPHTNTRISLCAPAKDAPVTPCLLPHSLPVQFK